MLPVQTLIRRGTRYEGLWAEVDQQMEVFQPQEKLVYFVAHTDVTKHQSCKTNVWLISSTYGRVCITSGWVVHVCSTVSLNPVRIIILQVCLTFLVVLQLSKFMFIPSLLISNCFVRFCRKISWCYSVVNRMEGRGKNWKIP